MKHPDNCDCPIHIKEDTTKVKYVALAAIGLIALIFMLAGCATTGTKAERPRGPQWDRI